MRAPIIYNIPTRYKPVYKAIRHHLRLLSFRERYYSEEKGWRFFEDKYIDDTHKDFPVKQAKDRFESLIKTIKENFPDRYDQHKMLTYIKPDIDYFNVEENKKNSEYLETNREKSKDESNSSYYLRYKREIEISSKIREVYIEKYKTHEYELSGRKEVDEKESVYIDKWIDIEVTSEDWFEYRHVDHWDIIDQLDLEEEVLEEIIELQSTLFSKHVDVTVDRIIEKYSSRQKDKRIEIIQKHLRDIKNFFEDGNTNESALVNLNRIYGGIRIPAVDLVKAYNDIVLQEFDFKNDLVLNVPGLHKSSPHFCAYVLFNYKEKSGVLLQDLLKKDRPKKVTQKSFKVKQPHKTDWLKDLLVQLNFKIDLLKENSSIDELFTLLTTNDFFSIEKPIHFSCETKQFVYIMDKLRPKFSKLTYAGIERSEKFISSEGNVITADNMSNSKTDYPKDKDEIDAVFNSLMN